jgi:death-on-curing protein
MGEEPIWVIREWVDAAHQRALITHGGLQGVRDANSLEAALASPRNLYAYGGEADLFRLAAHLLVAVVKCHGYNDGMKRTALSSAVMFLGANGIEVHLSDANAEHYTQQAARCTESERPEVETSIAFWLNLASRENSRD